MGSVGMLLTSDLVASSSPHSAGAVLRIPHFTGKFERLARCEQQRPNVRQRMGTTLKCRASENGAMSWNSAQGSSGVGVEQYRSRLESLLYCGKEIPEEKIEKPSGVPAEPLSIGNRPRCSKCEARGAVQCATCTGSGLYVDAILESQGIIVKVKCLGCGGSGSTMCPSCGGRGHN